MKKLLLVVLATLTMVVGCTYGPRANGQKPTAYIDAISPLEASQGVIIDFEGHGTDPAHDIVAYRWRSNLDGDLGVTKHFETSSLSEGVHIIYFKVQCERGNWSEEVTSMVSISSAASAENGSPGISSEPVITFFSASPVSVTTGDPSELSWEVSNATDVTIDQGIGPVSLSGTTGVSPATTTVYTLTATNAAGSSTASVQVIVKYVSPPSPTPTPGLPDLIIDDVMRSGNVISYKIKNQGDADAGATISELVIDGSIKGNDTVNPLSAGASREENFTYSYGCTGDSDSVIVRVDKGNAVTESNEGNNERSESWGCIKVTITPGPVLVLKPDLVILDIWRVSEITGDKVYYKIKNIGLGSSAGSTTALWIKPSTYAYTDSIGPLGPGDEVTKKFADFNLPPVAKTIELKADYEDVVIESDEGNNSREETT